MTQFLKKNAKIIYLAFGVFCFLFILIACVYITPYNGTAVVYNEQYLNGVITGLDGPNSELVAFCRAVGYDFDDTFYYMFSFNQSLQTANNMMLTLGVVSLIMFAIMMICANASRKKYYISNIVSGVACPIVCILVAIVTVVCNLLPSAYLLDPELYEIINWAALGNDITYLTTIEWYKAGDVSHFTCTMTPLIIYTVILVLFIIACGSLIAYNVFRYKETKRELSQSEKVVDANV